MEPARISKCHLCGNSAVLQRSHLLPAAMYKYLDPQKSNHVVINREKHFSTSRQLAAKLLCQECEQRFSRQGEKWVLNNGFRGQGNFPLQSLLKNSRPLYRTSSGLVFPGAGINGVDMDQLCYFGASIFWRAAAYCWHKEENIDLGAVYAEEFRRFLMGEVTFPSRAVLVVHVSSAEKPMEGAWFPSGRRVIGASYHQYEFMMPGMLFTLAVGQEIPPNLRLLCAVHSPQRLIFLSENVQNLLESLALEMIAGHGQRSI